MPLHDAALLLLGHGSTLNADSSAPTYQHAEEIRRRNIFAEVHVGFWKEEPNFRQALRQTSCRRVFVVPNFISSGYFTEQIIPRELGLKGSVTHFGEQEVYYCNPVGLSGGMTEILLRRAQDVVTATEENFDAKQACLFICGHGTSLNDNSTKIIHEQAEIIRAKGVYGDCQAVLMEQRPFVKDWRTLTDQPDVIVVPFFISDGLHSYEDIPVLLGLTPNVKEKGYTNPHREEGRRLWYATAIGTAPEIADAIVAQAEEFDVEQGTRDAVASDPTSQEVLRSLSTTNGPWTMGQVVIRVYADGIGGGVIELRHAEDHQGENLRELSSLEELRDLIRVDATGHFRPLRAAPNLERGWSMRAENQQRLQEILEYLYPAEIANLAFWRTGSLPVTSWEETAERQTGRFRIVKELDETGVRELAAQVCERGCLKRRLWAPAEEKVARQADGELPLLCPEACNYFVSKAREKLKGAAEEE